MVKLPLEWTSPVNTPDRAKIGLGCYTAQNCRIDQGVLQAEPGYVLQIPEFGAASVCWGGTFSRFESTEEYLCVVDDKLYKASPTDNVWTLVATGLAQSAWEFEQYGPKVYAVNATDGLRFHTIGGVDWIGGQVAGPTGSNLIAFNEKFYQQGTDPNNSIKTLLAAGTANFTVNTGIPAPAPALQLTGDSFQEFTFNKSYAAGTYAWRYEMVLAAAQNWQYQDVFQIDVQIPRGTFAVASVRLEIENATGTIVVPISGSQLQPSGNPQIARIYAFFIGSRTARQTITKIRVYWTFQLIGLSINSTDRFRVSIWVGDTWQNNSNGFLVDDGAIVAKRTYAYSAFGAAAALEGALSATYDSPQTPSHVALGSYTRVNLTQVTTGGLGAGDTLYLYRKRVSDSKWFRVGTTANVAVPAAIDDHYMEWELDALTEYGGLSSLPYDLKPHQIGSTKASLALAVNYDLYISKPNRPKEYESVNSAPDPEDPNQGRSVYVDTNRAEKVNAIKNGRILFLATKQRTSFMLGSNPSTMTSPQVLDNVGPIGNRASALFMGNLLALTKDALWLEGLKTFSDNEGDLTSEELTKDLRTTVESFGFDSSAVVCVHRGEIFVYQQFAAGIGGTHYLRLDRRYRRWHIGVYTNKVVAAAPDYSLGMRLFTKRGGLIEWNNGTLFSALAPTWTYETGDHVMKRSFLTNAYIIATGAPTMEIYSWDGKEGLSPAGASKIYTVDSSRFALADFQGHLHVGTKFRLVFSGTPNDTVVACVLEFEEAAGGEGR